MIVELSVVCPFLPELSRPLVLFHPLILYTPAILSHILQYGIFLLLIEFLLRPFSAQLPPLSSCGFFVPFVAISMSSINEKVFFVLCSILSIKF